MRLQRRDGGVPRPPMPPSSRSRKPRSGRHSRAPRSWLAQRRLVNSSGVRTCGRNYAWIMTLLVVAWLPGCAVILAQTDRGAIRGSVLGLNRRRRARRSSAGREHGDEDPHDCAEPRRWRLHVLEPASRHVPVDGRSLRLQERPWPANVAVHIGDTARADIQLEVGNVSESVEVTGSAVLVTPDTAAAGTVMTNKEYDTLPACRQFARRGSPPTLRCSRPAF